jgi:hypothetical protein
VYTFRQYVELVAAPCAVRLTLVNAPIWLALAGIRGVEPLLGDIALTREDLAGLQQEMLPSRAPATAGESVRAWLMGNGRHLGRAQVNDLDRHFGAGASAPALRP